MRLRVSNPVTCSCNQGTHLPASTQMHQDWQQFVWPSHTEKKWWTESHASDRPEIPMIYSVGQFSFVFQLVSFSKGPMARLAIHHSCKKCTNGKVVWAGQCRCKDGWKLEKSQDGIDRIEMGCLSQPSQRPNLYNTPQW